MNWWIFFRFGEISDKLSFLLLLLFQTFYFCDSWKFVIFYLYFYYTPIFHVLILHLYIPISIPSMKEITTIDTISFHKISKPIVRIKLISKIIRLTFNINFIYLRTKFLHRMEGSAWNIRIKFPYVHIPPLQRLLEFHSLIRIE